MIQEAFISGQIGQVLYTEDNRCFVLTVEDLERPKECQPMDASAFFGFGARFKSLSNRQLTLASLRSQLVAEQQAYYALTLMISGMDRVLSYDSRTAAIKRAESLITKESTHQFVRARLLSRPLPEKADLETALDIAINSNANSVGILYQRALDWDSPISLVYETWLSAAPDYYSSYEEQTESEIVITDLGIFADMAAALATNNLKALSSVVVTYGQKSELNSKVSQGVFILNDLRTRLAKAWFAQSKRLKAGRVPLEREKPASAKNPVHEMLAGFKNRRENPRSREFRANEAKEKVDHQIEAISRLILQGNISRANRYLQDLINFHIEHSEREHLGMSLCSLAKVAIDVHSLELAETLVDYALMLGIDDVVISTTHAQVLKTRGDFAKALAIYEETMERFPNNEVVRGGYADVLKSMGNFAKALAVYAETMERFPNNEVARSGYADVLKSMGDFDKALAVYAETMERFPSDSVARSGYAEVLKSRGDFDKALAVYAETMERFPNDEVPRNGYAEVLKSMRDFDKALAVYAETMERFPNDVVARGGYADVHKSMGNFDKALAVYTEMMARFPNNEVARNGYADVLKSMGDFDKSLAVYAETMERFPNSEVARNGYAEVLKSMGDFDKSLAVYAETMERFPNDEVVRNGYAEVLKSMGDFDKALALYEETLAGGGRDRITRGGYASVLILLNRFEEARSILPHTEPRFKDDWIDYHIIAMSYLKEGDTREAIRRLTYGFNSVPWPRQKSYFANALAVAKIRQKDFAAVPSILPTNVANVDFFQRQTRLALVGHCQAALGKNEEAMKTLAQLEQATNPRVINLKEAISRRYRLGPQSSIVLSEAEAQMLDSRIREQEFLLAA